MRDHVEDRERLYVMTYLDGIDEEEDNAGDYSTEISSDDVIYPCDSPSTEDGEEEGSSWAYDPDNANYFLL